MESIVHDNERQAYLTYLEQEYSLRTFQENEANFYNSELVKYGNSISSGNEAAKGMCRVANRLMQSARQILKSRERIAFIPDAASAMYSTWHKSYSDYLNWATAQFATLEAEINGIESHNEHVQEIFSQFEKSRQEAMKEERKLLKRLELNDGDLKRLFGECKNCAAKNYCKSRDCR